jgi:UDP-2,3-diacylglucosamine hydrolase
MTAKSRPESRPERLLLISDLHLEEARPELTWAFLQFIEQETPQASALYILGDFFNVWIGDDDDRPLNAVVSAALQRQAEAGLKIYLMHGNRDFLLGQHFARAAGASLIADPHVLEHGQYRYLLMHGDLLCTRDAGYQAFRTKVRDPAWQQTFLAAPLGERRAFAEQARATSKSMSSNKAEDIMDVSQDAVEAALIKHGCDRLVHGHTHRPDIHKFDVNGKPMRRIVLGDWGSQLWYLALTIDSEQLCPVPLTDYLAD